MAQFFDKDIVLLERIAAGGMAEVFRAKLLGMGGFEKVVALKRVLRHHADKSDFKEMFRKEAVLSSLLHHQNIAQVYRNGEYDGYLYLAMEYVNGKNARQLLGMADKLRKRIPIELSCYIISEAARGLHYAHVLKDENTDKPLDVIHRDISPQNVMLGYDGLVKVVDFGIAKAAFEGSEDTKVGVLKGKFGYMSPEQAEGHSLDARSDVFSLGIVLFELLTQRRLFTSKDDLKTLRLVQECRVPRPSKYNPNVDDQLDAIVLKAMAKDYKQRFQSCEELELTLEQYQQAKYDVKPNKKLAEFLTQLFADKILEEKKTRDKNNAEGIELISAFQKQLQKPRSSVEPISNAIDNSKEIDLLAEKIGSIENVGDASKVIDLSTLPKTSQSNVAFKDNGIMELTLSKEQDQYQQKTSDDSKTSTKIEKSSVNHSAIGLSFKLAGRKYSKIGKYAALGATAILIVFFVVGNLTNSIIAEQSPPKQKKTKSNREENKNTIANQVQDPNVDLVNKVPVEEQARIPANALFEVHGHDFGYLTLRPLNLATEIRVDGKPLYDRRSKRKLGTPLVNFKLKPGNYRVELINADLKQSWSGDIKIESDRIKSLENFTFKQGL